MEHECTSRNLDEYRRDLLLAEEKAQESFDKTVLTLSGGALGISFAFLEKIVQLDNAVCLGLLFASWLTWGLSVTSVLLSFFLSQLALRHAIVQVDKREIHTKRPGGFFDLATAIGNVAGLVLFLAGVILLLCFIYKNLEVG